jgi:hypothetical protein
LEGIVMSSVKETLYHSIERLSDEEAHQTLAFIQQLHEQRDVASVLRRLAQHPAFRLPAETQGGFRAVEPLHGTGIPASRRLLEERR